MAWTITTEQNFFANFTTTAVLAYADTAAINSDVITAKDWLLGDQYIVAGINVTVGGTDVVADLLIQYSTDNTNWFTHSTVIADTTPNVTGLKLASVNLTGYSFPYWRLRFNNAAADVDTTGRFKFVVVGKDPQAMIWTAPDGMPFAVADTRG